jgi:metalloendopeptidase OMA1, mitochondrial
MRSWNLFLTASLLALPACGNLNFYSEEDLEPLSVQAYAEASDPYKIITSGGDYELVQRVAQGITRAADRNFPWEARLLQADDIPNAFCLPNGRIAIYTGILKITQNPDGLAAVMGHEVAHATLEHGGKRMTQSQITSMLGEALNTGLNMSEMDQGTHDLIISAFGIGGQYIFTLPYSRDHESEADIEGIRYAIRAGYDPWEAPKLWERMAELGSSGPEWMSTHPDPLNRAKKLREVIPRIIEEERNWQPSGVTQ